MTNRLITYLASFLTLITFVTVTAHGAPDIHSRFISSQQGLPDNTVRYIHQDRHGYMWFGTMDGLARYDGYRFVNFRQDDSQPITLTDYQVREIHEDDLGYLWVLGGNNHVSCLDPVSQTFVDFTGRGLHERPFRKMAKIGADIWMWGERGVMRVSHDGGKFRTETFSREDGTLTNDNVRQLFSGGDNDVWFGTDDGVYRVRGGKAERVLGGESLQWLTYNEDNGTTWFVTVRGKVYRMDRKATHPLLVATLPGVTDRDDLTGSVSAANRWYLFTSAGPAYGFDMDKGTAAAVPAGLQIPGGRVAAVDAAGDYWINNETGRLVYYNTRRGITESIEVFTPAQTKYLDMERIHVALDQDGKAWISTNGNGLFIYDKATGETTHLTEGLETGKLIPSNNLLYVATDRQGSVWVGAEHIGAAELSERTDHRAITPPGIDATASGQANSFRLVKRIGADVYVGTRSGELMRYDGRMDKVLDRQQLPATAYDIMRDSQGRLWTGTRGSGVYVDGQKLTADGAPVIKDVFSLAEDRGGRVWIGTFGQGLVEAVRQNGSWDLTAYFTDSYNASRIRAVTVDSYGNVWAGGNDGFVIFDPQRLHDDPKTYTGYSNLRHNFRDNTVHAFARDRQGRMWIGTGRSGVAIAEGSPDSLSFKYISVDEGLVHPSVMSITPIGNTGQMMVATEYGLSRLDKDGTVLENYVLASAPKGNVYEPNSVMALNDSTIIAGSINGLYTLNPYQSQQNALPKVTITGMRSNGTPVKFGADASATVELAANQTSFEVDFSTLDFGDTDKILYSYCLENHDKEWSSPTAESRVSYKNLEPGDYVLQVRASRNDGRWSEPTALHIHVATPWYASWWAKAVYMILIIIGLIMVFSVLRKLEGLRNRIKIEEQLTDYKLEFFTNISHEFRTPLTLIQVSIEKIRNEMSRADGQPNRRNLTSPVATLDRNSQRMSRLINELLTFRKVEKNKLTLAPQPTEVVGFVREIFNGFTEEAQQKRLTYTMRTALTDYTMNVDRDSLDKIVYNLLSNAIKYTLQGGRVEFVVSVNETTHMLQLQVRDNGIGIPADKKHLLFSRFMQTNFSQKSIGVGLHLTFGLVQLYGGEIRHADNEGGGSVFTVEIPTTLEAVAGATEDALPGALATAEASMAKADNDPEADEPIEITPPETGLRLLIIDDDAEIREILNEEFEEYFTVITAADGTSGLKAAREEDVDLVICDVMMPDMSGFEVTRRLKEDISTSHIPIIQLTALTNDESQIRGIETGADAYITKPFSMQFLKARAFKLIELRKILMAKFASNPSMPRPELPLVSRDREFAEKLNEIVLSQMDNSGFTADDFAAAMNMGRTIFFKKVKGVTGYSPKEYIRVMRMKKAADLLLTTDLTISEVTYEVGMTDPAYFNRCFKAQFGKAPSVYQKENKKC